MIRTILAALVPCALSTACHRRPQLSPLNAAERSCLRAGGVHAVLIRRDSARADTTVWCAHPQDKPPTR